MSVNNQVEKATMSWFQKFKEKVSTAFQGLGYYLPNPFKNLMGVQNAVADKTKLDNFREEYYQKISAMQQQQSPDYVGLIKDHFYGIIARNVKSN